MAHWTSSDGYVLDPEDIEKMLSRTTLKAGDRVHVVHRTKLSEGLDTSVDKVGMIDYVYYNGFVSVFFDDRTRGVFRWKEVTCTD